MLDLLRKLKPGRLITIDSPRVKVKAASDDLEVLAVRFYSHPEDGHVAFLDFPDDQCLVVHDLGGGEKAYFMELAETDDLEPSMAEFPPRVWVRSGGREVCYRQTTFGSVYGFADEKDDDSPEASFCEFAAKGKGGQALAVVTDAEAALWVGFRVQRSSIIL